MTRRIWLYCISFIILTWILWWMRISDYAEVAGPKSSNPANYSDWTAAGEILGDANGWIPLGLNLACVGFMFWFWRGFHLHMVYSCAEVDEKLPKLEPREQRRWSVINDPPGDIFTLIGIAFTFLGLAFSMLTISAEIIAALAGNDRNIGQSLAQSAIVFGSSLGVGLLASLFGVILAVDARWIAAQCCPEVSPPWHTANAIDHLHSMPELLSARLNELPPPLDAALLANAFAEALAAAPAFAGLTSSMNDLKSTLDTLGRAMEAEPERDQAANKALTEILSTVRRRIPEDLDNILRVRLEGAVTQMINGLKPDEESGPGSPPPPGGGPHGSGPSGLGDGPAPSPRRKKPGGQI